MNIPFWRLYNSTHNSGDQKCGFSQVELKMPFDIQGEVVCGQMDTGVWSLGRVWAGGAQNGWHLHAGGSQATGPDRISGEECLF